jgi:hypothetical protein
MSVTPSSEIVSNPVTFGVSVTTSSAVIFTNTKPGTCFVVTFIQLINTSSSSGDSILIEDRQTTVAVHSGVAGAGSYDRFPLSCDLAYFSGNGLAASSVTGDWDVTVTGHYTPATMTS